jgi:hypothetical protein
MSRKMSKLVVTKLLTLKKTQSREQIYKYSFRNQQFFFTEKRSSPIMNEFLQVLESLNLTNRDLGGDKRDNCQLTNL